MHTQTDAEANRLMEQQHLGGIGGDNCNDDCFGADDCYRCGAELEDDEIDGLCGACRREL